MNEDESHPKLRLAPLESSADLERRIERERRAEQRRREDNLSQSLAPFRVGSVPHLNAVPLTRGLEDQIRFLPPAQLGDCLRRGELDAALLSVTESLLDDQYDVLDGIAVASLGEVKSVLLAHRQPLAEIREVFCDPVSLTSRLLLEVLLAEHGIRPVFRLLPDTEARAWPDAVLLIGDRALNFLFSAPEHAIWDLGDAWYEWTQLPFVYAVWTLRRELDHAPLRRQLREAKDFGMDTLDQIIRGRTDYPADFLRDYLGWHIHYHLGSDEKRGIRRFVELLCKHGLGAAREPHYVF